MKYKITHITEYEFNSEVFLEPHYFRFRPKNSPYIMVEDSKLTVTPIPAGFKLIRDEENNLVYFCWFEGLTKNLSIVAESTVETLDINPFDFILHPQSYYTVPFNYDDAQKKLLSASLSGHKISDKLIDYGTKLQEDSNHNTINYLTNLTAQVHTDFVLEYREEGAPLPPDETFNQKRGSCRDLSWMQINLLREQGFATRFVSGYFYFEMDASAYELHAWLEVFLPGAGWLGLDPSHGMLTGSSHFTIASSAYYENTMPVSGGIRGSASSKLMTNLSIDTIL